LNNQPWRFAVIKNKSLKDKLSRLTEYSPIIKKANCVIVVFLDKNSSYNYVKDVQAIGACIENMLLASLELGIRSCWIGEILNKEKRVNRLLDIARRYELMAAVALGYSSQKQKSNRISLDKLILKEIL
jgi:nitroreductase